MANDDDALLTISVPEWTTAIEPLPASERRDDQVDDSGSASPIDVAARTIRIIDLETTGLGPCDEVVEVAAIDLDCDSGEICAFGSQIIRPRNPIPPQASAVHHITDADVADAPIWDDVWPHFFNGDGNVVAFAAHKASFEGQWLGEQVGDKPLICTHKAALRIWPDAPGHANQVLRYWLKLPLVIGFLVAPVARPRSTARSPASSIFGRSNRAAHITRSKCRRGILMTFMPA